MFNEKDAKISIFDRGFLYWDALFETIPVVNWKIFWLNEHLDRLFNWCDEMHINIPWTKNDLIKFCNTIVKENNNHNYEKIKIILSRGVNGCILLKQILLISPLLEATPPKNCIKMDVLDTVNERQNHTQALRVI